MWFVFLSFFLYNTVFWATENVPILLFLHTHLGEGNLSFHASAKSYRPNQSIWLHLCASIFRALFAQPLFLRSFIVISVSSAEHFLSLITVFDLKIAHNRFAVGWGSRRLYSSTRFYYLRAYCSCIRWLVFLLYCRQQLEFNVLSTRKKK